MPQEDDSRAEIEKTLKVFRMIFVAYHQSAEVEEPGEESFDFPAANVAAEAASVLGADASVLFIGGDHFGAELLHHLFIQSVTVIGFVANQPFGHVGHEAIFHRWLHQFHFRWRSTLCPQGERKTVAV